jgi:2-polyprenyl-3-methyl-5-hydroxy-6-metoxy-1,4-benzoquinol methylase
MTTPAETEFDYYHAHYRHVNANFDVARYRRIIQNEHRDILDRNKRILDVGCGAGFLLEALEREGYARLWGVELDENQYRVATSRLTHAKLAHQDAFAFLERTDESFDVIFFYDLLEHVRKPDVVPLLRLAREALQAGGALVIKTPNAESPLFATRMRYVDFTHEVMFSQDSIRMVLRQAGFERIACRATKDPPGATRLPRTVLRMAANLLPRLALFAYFGRAASRWILTPNFITVAIR